MVATAFFLSEVKSSLLASSPSLGQTSPLRKLFEEQVGGGQVARGGHSLSQGQQNEDEQTSSPLFKPEDSSERVIRPFPSSTPFAFVLHQSKLWRS